MCKIRGKPPASGTHHRLADEPVASRQSPVRSAKSDKVPGADPENRGA